MNNSQEYSIRPAGRHLLTIGRDLIQDQYAAIVELVKNSYDADSSDVNITFRVSPKRDAFVIAVEDHGHGMSRDTVVNNWLVPSTEDKLNRRVSPNGRIMQGNKGIGRYAASILGKDLLLETVTSNGEKTIAYLQWSEFEKKKYLDEVPVLVETYATKETQGTKLTISGENEKLSEWTDDQLKKLRFELKKLIPPIDFEFGKKKNKETFSIFLHFDNFYIEQEKNGSEEIKPYPLVELFDYRISGRLGSDGIGTFFHINQRARNTIEETIPINLREPTGCGKLAIDIRIYDREAAAIAQLIGRGLKDDDGNYVGKRDARQILNQYNGIGVFRNGFRIRPLGDPDFDWLKLNEQRIQNPSQKIGSNQAIGYVQIESEESSGLIETSARDGLKNNSAYLQLKKITQIIINELETRRYIYRKSAGLSRTTAKIERDLERLFTFDQVKQGVQSKLVTIGVPKQEADEIIDLISQKEDEANQIVKGIKTTVAIYQGQATLGKIINVILHEGRKPLNFFKNQIPNLKFWANELSEKYEPKILDELIPIATGLGQNASSFVDLFSRLDPLATRKRATKKEFLLCEAITNSFLVFENELIRNKITFNVDCPKELMFTGWYQDIFVIITNLIDNSLFWIIEKHSPEKEINITVSKDEKQLAYIDYRDTGPGIEPHLIESEVIFEPEFTTKIQGTGLGLAIAGEAAVRNGLELKAFVSYTGAYFRIQPELGSN